jgi:glutathione S-transferase
MRAHRPESAMSDFMLHCFAESGNAYKVALLMEVSGLKWTPVDVNFFNGQTRTAEWRENANEMGEVPVLYHNGLRLTQSGVILHYLSDIVGRYGGRDEAEKREIWRWILFDNKSFRSCEVASTQHLQSSRNVLAPVPS